MGDLLASFDQEHTWRRYTLLLHGLGWAGYLVVIILLWNLGAVGSQPASLFRFFLTVILILPGLFYVNVLVLIPRFFQKRHLGKWIMSHIGLILAVVGIEVFISTVLASAALADVIGPAFLSGLGWVVTMTSIAFIYRYLVDGIAMPIRMERLQAERDAAELAFLKSQVDPHFLFNTLNNLYSLALDEDAPQTADSIALLGRLMRYSLHDAQAKTITLEKEVQYLETYVALQRLRAMPNASIEFVVEIPEASLHSLKIAPMLLIPFVENAFKYGLHASRQTFVRIHLGITEGNLAMECSNTIAREAKEGEPGKVGYQNVKQRLEHLYPDAHTVYIESENQIYSVNLEVHL
ncbi:MAG: sensor histidine kinase [Rhodothermaceae bacterium]|nr:sensor histidine kinase [Rhodothermaceae bacterium]